MLTFEFDGAAAEADSLARDLAEWLDDDEDLRGAARVRMAPPAPGEQGALADAVEVAGVVEPLVTAGVGAFAMWLAERVKARRIVFRAVRPDGARIELSAGTAAEAAAVREDLERFVNGGGESGADRTAGTGG
ncbi:effector-associated constant component EACC1 [Streptomyces sp. 8N706]|uniref:effector-associated constant component EACC1 n=1 Tax=Streptomyces sp. 8N706 TaxID=3457416 RepID=UPI003FCF260B